MGKIEDVKTIYDNIEIPDELRERVMTTVKNQRILHQHSKKKNRHYMRWGTYGVAAAAAALVIGLNTSSAFAAAAGNVPVFGKVVEVLTFRNYETDVDKTVLGEIPGVSIEMPTVEEAAFTEEVNAKIKEACDAYVKGAIQRVEEYKEAFIATGGSEEEFAEHNIVITVDYEIKAQSEEVLSFVVNGTENWASAYAMSEYYNLDLKNLTYLTLEDVLGEDYIEIANNAIRSQIAQQETEGIIYWTEAEGGFSTIDAETKFYINEAGLPVVVFEKYEIAPGAAGSPEFVIDAANADRAE